MRNTTSYKKTTTARNGITRTINRRDDAALTTREVASIFNRLMFRPGKWVGLTGFSEGATRWGQGTRRAFGNVHRRRNTGVILLDPSKNPSVQARFRE